MHDSTPVTVTDLIFFVALLLALSSGAFALYTGIHECTCKPVNCRVSCPVCEQTN